MSMESILYPNSTRAIRNSLRDLLREGAFHPNPCEDRWAAMNRVYAQLRLLNRWAGSGRALLADPARYFAVLDFVAVFNPALLHIAHVHYGVCLYSALILHNGAIELDEVVGAMDRADSVGSILITELGYANSHLAVGTIARYDAVADEFELTTPSPINAKFMPSVGLAGVPKTGVVFARVQTNGAECGVYPFLVPLRDARGRVRNGVSIHLLPGDCSIPTDHSMVSFDNVRVPRSAWLGEDAKLHADGKLEDPTGSPDRRLIRSLTAFRNAAAAAAVGSAAMARASVFITLHYAERRITMGRLAPGRPILDFQAHQRVLFCALARAVGATCLVNRLTVGSAMVAASGSGFSWAPWAAVHRDLGITKVVAVTIAEEAIAACRHVTGAQSALHINRLRVYEDFVGAYHNAGGDNNLVLFDTGRDMALGIDYQPPAAVAPSVTDLRDPETLRYIAALRERELHDQLIATLPVDRTELDSLTFWNANLELAADLARAYGDRLLLESLLDAAADARDERPLLEALATLYVLDRVQPRNHDAASRDAIRGALELLMRHRAKILAALDVRPELHGVPIVSDDYVKEFV